MSHERPAFSDLLADPQIDFFFCFLPSSFLTSDFCFPDLLFWFPEHIVLSALPKEIKDHDTRVGLTARRCPRR